MDNIALLDPVNIDFPPIESALVEPNGLLAVGGDLSTERLLAAYRNGIFPWNEEDQPLLWWSPDPRAVLFPSELRISRSLGKRLKRNEFEIRLDTNFEAVIYACAQSRSYSSETWITAAMQSAYIELHKLGYAHSIESYRNGQLSGGLYGISIGRMFFGESMFHIATDASKVAFAYLCRLMSDHNGPLIDCQLENPHLESLGSRSIPRQVFKTYLDDYCEVADPIEWHNLPSSLPNW